MSFRYILFQSIPNKEFISVSYIPLVFDLAVYSVCGNEYDWS